MNILAIESSASTCSVAFKKLDGEAILAEEHGFVHAERLAVMVDQMVKTQGKPDLIALSAGPGSYTGLRIGTSLAKGLCTGWQIPLVAIPTLKALAWAFYQQFPDLKDLVFPMVDARRMEVYSAGYDFNLKKIKETEAVVLEGNWLQDIYGTKHLIGDAAAKCVELFSKRNDVILHQGIQPSALNLISLGALAANDNQFEDIAGYEPFYLKSFQVQHKRT